MLQTAAQLPELKLGPTYVSSYVGQLGRMRTYVSSSKSIAVHLPFCLVRVIKMAAAENLQLIKNAYAAFQRGDITAILNSCGENVECLGATGTDGVLPQASLRRGRVAVAEFFKHVAETTGFTAFQPQEFVAQRDTVVAVGNYTARMRSSGQWMSSSWVMLFTVRNGKVVRFREYSDSAQIVRAFRSVAISA
jgi:uncharacterized protein